MLIELDQNTLANMTAALEFVCKKLPEEMDSSAARKKVAREIIACARAGKRNCVDFVDTGSGILTEMTQPARFDWFGLRR